MTAMGLDDDGNFLVFLLVYVVLFLLDASTKSGWV